MTLFKTWKKQKLVLSDVEPTYKVRYLGNVQTGFVKGDGCVDKPTSVLWNNYTKNGHAVGLEMALTICGTGMRAVTREQGLTEYRAHRISYCVAHPDYPRLFVWIYRHEAKRMKVELRCHAVLCKTAAKAKLMAVQLHDRLAFALNEFLREKTRRQNSRLTLQRAGALTSTSAASAAAAVSGAALRNKFLSTAQNFKPSIQNSAGAPKLGAITENVEEEEEEEEDEEENGVLVVEDEQELSEKSRQRQGRDEGQDLEREPVEDDVRPGPVLMNTRPSMASLQQEDDSGGERTPKECTLDELENGVYDLVIGNDIEQLKLELENDPDDSDAESSESGFSEQGELKDGAVSGPIGNGDVLENGRGVVGNASNNNSVGLEPSAASVKRRNERRLGLNSEDLTTAL